MTWNDILKEYFTNEGKPLLQKLKSYKGQKLAPSSECMFNAYSERNCSFENTKVVILYNEPIPDSRIADGLAFSSKIESHIQKSLKGLYNILYSTFYSYMGADKFKKSFNGNLLNWAKQGIVLANIRLTVQEGIPMSHANIGWEDFTKYMITLVSRLKKAEEKKILFIFVGKEAHSYSSLIANDFHTKVEVQDPASLVIQDIDKYTKDLFKGISMFTYLYYAKEFAKQEINLGEAFDVKKASEIWQNAMHEKGYASFINGEAFSQTFINKVDYNVSASVGFDFRTNIKN